MDALLLVQPHLRCRLSLSFTHQIEIKVFSQLLRSLWCRRGANIVLLFSECSRCFIDVYPMFNESFLSSAVRSFVSMVCSSLDVYHWQRLPNRFLPNAKGLNRNYQHLL